MPLPFGKRRGTEDAAPSRRSFVAKLHRKKEPTGSAKDSDQLDCPSSARSTLQVECDLGSVHSKAASLTAMPELDSQVSAGKATTQALGVAELCACIFEVSDYLIGQGELALLPGVYSTRAGRVGQKEAVQLLYDVSLTCPQLLSQSSGRRVVDNSHGFRVAPPEHQKHALQQSGLTVPLTQIAEGGKVFNSGRFASRLNAYCLGFGSAPELDEDCKYLTPTDRNSLQVIWKEVRQKPSCPSVPDGLWLPGCPSPCGGAQHP